MRKQIPTSQLLALLDSMPEAPVKHNPSAAEVKLYIESSKIQLGESWVPAYVIYNHYANWKAGVKPLHNTTFFKEFRKTFPGKRRMAYNYYKTDYKSFGLTEEQYNTLMTEVDNAEKERNRANSKKQYEKNKKKSAKVSRSS